jgi:hypothetical protein
MIRIFLVFIIIFSLNCKKKEEPKFKVEIGQEMIFINQEFENSNYEKVIEFVDEYFKNNELNENNAEILLKKVEAIEKLIPKLKNEKFISKYGLKIKDKKIYYDYKDLKNIWEKLPDSEVGKKSFLKYFENIPENEKLSELENYISKTKKYNIDFLSMLADYYISKFQTNIPYEKLLKIYEKIENESIDEFIKNEAFINKSILKLKYEKDFDFINNEFKNKEFKGDYLNFLKYYILGTFYFKKYELKLAKKFFSMAEKLSDKLKKQKMNKLLVALENFPADSIENFKIQIKKKLDLIDLMLKYDDTISNKLVGVIVGKRVRIRKEPLMKTKNILNSLNFGEFVIILERSNSKEEVEGVNDYWYKVQLKDGTVGWVFGKYLTIFI